MNELCKLYKLLYSDIRPSKYSNSITHMYTHHEDEGKKQHSLDFAQLASYEAR